LISAKLKPMIITMPFLTDLSFSRSSRFRIPPSTVFELDIGAVCAALTAFIIEFRGKSWKSWRLLVSRTLMAGYDLGRRRHFADNSPALLCIVVQVEQRAPFLDT
jgi:hypothetical protein